MKPVTLETLIADQKDRIDRCNAKPGDNAVMDYINDINDELKQS